MENSAVPKVSVIIPLYNKAPYIKRALDSVLAQTVQDFEVIVVNDGSKDGGEKIVEGYGDSRIHLINQENQGVSAARNRGVDAAKAELVAFLDADDEWLPLYLETILQLRNLYPNGGIYSTARYYVKPNGKKTIIGDVCKHSRYAWRGVVPSIFRYAAINGTFPGNTSSITVPRSVFLSAGGFLEDVSMGEDWELWARILFSYPYIHSPNPCVYYMHDDVNAATKNTNLFLLEKHPVQQSIEYYIRTHSSIEKSYLKDLYLYYDSLNITVASHNLSVGNYKKAREILGLIQHPELRKRKWATYIRSYIPERVVSLLRELFYKL